MKTTMHTVVMFDGIPPIFTQNIIHINQSAFARIDHSVIGDENDIYDVR